MWFTVWLQLLLMTAMFTMWSVFLYNIIYMVLHYETNCSVLLS